MKKNKKRVFAKGEKMPTNNFAKNTYDSLNEGEGMEESEIKATEDIIEQEDSVELDSVLSVSEGEDEENYDVVKDKFFSDINTLDTYYRDIKDHSYLSREEELELFKKFENVKSELTSIVLNSFFTIPEIVELSDKLQEHDAKIKEIIDVNPFDELYLADVSAKTEMFMGVVSIIGQNEKKLLSCVEKYSAAMPESKSGKTLSAYIKEYHHSIAQHLSKIPFNFIQIEKTAQEIVKITSETTLVGKTKAKIFLEKNYSAEKASKILKYLAISDKKELKDKSEQIKSMLKSYSNIKVELVNANLRFVVSISKKYQNRGLQLLDLVQEGNIGLMTAIDKFDYRRGIKFCSYAHWWIQQTIMKALMSQGKTIRIPVHIVDKIRKLKWAFRTMSQDLERKPTIAEMAKKVGMDEDFVRSVLMVQKEPVSIDESIDDDENETSLANLIENPDALSPEFETSKKDLKERLRDVLRTLNPREEKILRMRYGIDFGVNHTLEEIGEDFKLSRERIRQIEEEAIKKLRRNGKLKELKLFFVD